MEMDNFGTNLHAIHARDPREHLGCQWPFPGFHSQLNIRIHPRILILCPKNDLNTEPLLWNYTFVDSLTYRKCNNTQCENQDGDLMLN